MKNRWRLRGPRWKSFCGLALVFLALAGTSARAQTGLTLRGDSVEGAAGMDVMVVFRTEGFWQITQGMGTIQWDPHVIDYVSAGDFGIPPINEGTFSLIPSGMLTFDWDSNNLLGNTLADGSVLFSLKFNVRGDAGDATTVAFTNGWTPLHFESAESINLPFSSVAGNVTVVPEPALTGALFGLGLLALGARRRQMNSARRIPRLSSCSASDA